MRTTIEQRGRQAAAVRGRIKRGAAMLSIAVNLFLLALKAAVALLTGSVALWASAADSLQDLAASAFAFVGVKLGSRPPDDTHPYGHEKFESLSSLAQLSLLFVTVGIIAYESIRRLVAVTPEVAAPVYGIAVIVVSLGLDFWIARRLLRAAKESGGSQALEADALHFTTDVWSNLAVIVGLSATALGFPEADPIAALVVAVLVAVTAARLLTRTTGVLTDHAPDEHTIRDLIAVIQRFPEVVDHHTLRARLVGSRIFLDVCVELDPELSFRRAHDMSHELADALHEGVPHLADVVIHFEPAGHPAHQDDAHHSHGFDALAVEPRDED